MYPVIAALLLACFAGFLGTLWMLRELLVPIDLTAEALRSYIDSRKLPDLPVHFPDRAGKLMEGTQYTLTQLHETINRLERVSDTDDLTGIYNRRAGEKRLAEEIARAERDLQGFQIAFFDINDFKAINDNHGHSAGDACISHMAALLQLNTRRGDWVARWGGDEFVVGLHRNRALKMVMERIVKAFDDLARARSRPGREIVHHGELRRGGVPLRHRRGGRARRGRQGDVRGQGALAPRPPVAHLLLERAAAGGKPDRGGLTMRWLLLPVILPAALLVSGCATVIAGTNQTLTVNSVPQGATCRLTRDGTEVATIASTPGTLALGKSSGYLRVVCAKPGYLDAVVTMVSHVHTSTFWNNAGFGIIGLGVDSASGAMYHYVPELTVNLIDEEFESEASRDATFYGITRITQVEGKGAREAALRGCLADCNAMARALDAALDARLADIEKKRLAAKVKK